MSQGFSNVYNFAYGHSSTSEELNLIKSNCSANSILCAGGALAGSDNLLLVSCGNCLSVLSSTPHNQPVLINGAYWYFTPNYSFGYAPTNSVSQNTCDNFNPKDPLRLCYHLDQYVGGWSIGTLTYLNYDTAYVKILLLKI